MRKLCFVVLLLVLAGCCALSFAAEEYSLAPCAGKMFVLDGYIALTPANLDDHPELLSNIGKTKEELLEDWTARNVILQAWTAKQDAFLEVSVFQDEDSGKYYDLEQQTRQIRNEYRKAFVDDPSHTEQGYLYSEVNWKKQKYGGNFLRYKYKQTLTDGNVRRGYAGRTVRNGYSLLFDYQVVNRALKGNDDTQLNNFLNTVMFEDTQPQPQAENGDTPAPGSEEGEAVSPVPLANGLLQVDTEPPRQTNSDTFTVEGHTTPGGHLIGVLMRPSSATPLHFTADATPGGYFKMKVTMPEEGLWLLTLNLDINDTIVAEKVFQTTTFSRTLIPVTFDTEVPEELTTDELVISGVTSKAVTVQCIVTNGLTTFDKSVRTNGNGKFTFKIPTMVEAEYDIVVVFSKKGFDTRREPFKATRTLTEADRKKQTAADAIKPAYATLVKKLDTYIGRTMGYNAYITNISQNGDEWIITAALRKNKDIYSDFLYFMSKEPLDFEAGTRLKLYGKCIGAYQIQSEEGSESYPGFDYLYHD